MKVLRLIFLGKFLIISGCWWQEQACNISLGPEDTGKVFHYDECKAINDPATRGWLLNKR